MMNFFTIGFVFCLLNFNIGHPANYIVKFIGSLFMLGGIKETAVSEDSFGFDKYKTDVLITLALSVCGTVLSLLSGFEVISGNAVFACITVVGTLTFASTLFHQYRIIKQMRPMKALVNDPSLLEKLYKAWKGYAVTASITMLCQMIMRHSVSGRLLHTFSGTVFLIAIIVQYVLLVHMGGAMNDVRTDYNVMHPIEPSERINK